MFMLCSMEGRDQRKTTSMTGMNNSLAQLALLLHGMGRGGFSNQFNLPTDPYSTAPQTPQPMTNSWATMPMPSGHSSIGGTQGSVIPAQWAATAIPFELFGDLAGRGTLDAPPYPETMPMDIPPSFQPLPPYNPYWQIPDVDDDGTKLPPITIPQWPDNPPFPLPEGLGDETKPLPNPIPQRPYNPPLEIPDEGIGEGIDEGISELRKGPRTMSRKCQKEWGEAAKHCHERKWKLQDQNTGEDVNFDELECMKNMVSQACGGTLVKWGPHGKPYKPFITA
jgi:hypothetical protein